MMILLVKIAIIMVLCGVTLAFVSETLSELIDDAPKWVYKAFLILCILFLTIVFIGMVFMFVAMLIGIWTY